MRESYHVQLDSIMVSLVGLTETVADAVGRTTRALLEADLQLAERVISDDAIIDNAHDDIEQRAFTLLARQAPVAGELRTIVAALRMVNALGRMGDLAAHIAKLRLIRTGRERGEGIEVLAGLDGGESLVIEGAAKLLDGQPLTVTP